MSKFGPNPPAGVTLESPLHALGLLARARQAGPERRLVAHELASLGYLVLRGRADDAGFLDGVAGVLGAVPPTQPLSVAPCAAGALVWMSPDEWLLVCRHAVRHTLHHALVAALAGQFAQVVDNSGGMTALRLAGDDHVRLLRHLVPYDPARLTVGRAVGTVMSKASVTLLRSDPAGVIVLVRRSFADYVWRLIERAGQPYGFTVTAPAYAADPLLAPLLQPA